MNNYILKALEEKEKALVNKKNALYIEADSIDKELKKCTKLHEYIEEPSKFLDMTPKEAVSFFKTCGIDDEKEIKSTYVRLIHQAMQLEFDIENDEHAPINIGDKTEEIETKVEETEKISYSIFPEDFDKYVRRLLSPKKEKQSEMQAELKKEMISLLNNKVSHGGVVYKIDKVEVPIFIVKDRLDKMLRGDAKIEDIIPITTVAICYESDQRLTKQDVERIKEQISSLTKSIN